MNLHYQSRSKKDPRRLRLQSSSAAECRNGRPLAAQTLGPEAPTPATRTGCRDPSPRRTIAPKSPAPPPHPARQFLLPGGDGRGETRRPCWLRRAGTERRPSGAERGEKGVNPEVHRPPASRWEHWGNKSGPAKAGHRCGSQTATCCETCHFPTWPRPSPLPGAHASSFLPAQPHRAPLDVAHVPDPGPRAASAPARTPGHTRTRPAAGRAAYLRGLMVASLARAGRGRGCE